MISRLFYVSVMFTAVSAFFFGQPAVIDKSKRSIFDFSASYGGNPVSLSDFRGKSAYLIVNVASK